MSYLRRFPIDKLKIDRSFINEVMQRPDDASIVREVYFPGVPQTQAIITSPRRLTPASRSARTDSM